MDEKKPHKNVLYKFATETGKVITLRFLCETENGRFAFQNVGIKNVLTMTKKRFTYLHDFCLIEKKETTEQNSAVK
jgi:hypothetical protein